MKLEILVNNRFELYNFDSNLIYIETDVAYVLFLSLVCHTYVSIEISRPRNCKQWLEYQQCWSNHYFGIDGLSN